MGALILALLVGVVMLLFMGVNPLTAFGALLNGAFGNKFALANTIVKATPILFVGLGICISFRAGVLNIGGEGQLVVGGLTAISIALAIPTWPGWIVIILACLGGAIAGAIWGGIAGLLKAYFKVNEVLSTIMLNYIAVYLMTFLIHGPLMDPKQQESGSFIPETARIARSCDLPRLTPTRAHIGILIAIVLAVLVYIFLWRTTIGFRLRMIGKSKRASLNAGINVKSYTILALLLGGAFAGLGGAVEILGVRYNMFTDSSMSCFTSSAGFNGIVAALFGQLHPIGAIPASFLLGALLSGAQKMQRVVQVPSALIGTLNGLIVLFVVGSEVIRRRLAARAELTEEKEADFKREQDSDFEESGQAENVSELGDINKID